MLCRPSFSAVFDCGPVGRQSSSSFSSVDLAQPAHASVAVVGSIQIAGGSAASWAESCSELLPSAVRPAVGLPWIIIDLSKPTSWFPCFKDW